MLIPKKVKEIKDGTRSSLFASDIRMVSVCGHLFLVC